MEESKSSASAPEEEPSLFTAAEPSPPEAPPAAPSPPPPPPPAAPHDAAPAPAPAAAAPADTRRQELLEALAAKQISKVCRIVERLKFDVDAPLNDDGETAAVHVCVHHCGTRRDPGFVPVLRCLLRLGANPDAARAGGQMPAHRCAAFDLTPMLALLGEFGAEVDREDDEGYAPAHVCAAWGKTSALEWLLTRARSTPAAPRQRHGSRPVHDHGHGLLRGRDHAVKWLVGDCGVGKCESEIVVVDPAYIDEVTAREREAERRAKEELTARRGAGKEREIPKLRSRPFSARFG
ncbi:hypothetical protein JL720_14091 [Aureococcus anophagefferens]|nr:hypothetical protein JL720_14091 [Aureococcus anophagefferens]